MELGILKSEVKLIKMKYFSRLKYLDFFNQKTNSEHNPFLIYKLSYLYL